MIFFKNLSKNILPNLCILSVLSLFLLTENMSFTGEQKSKPSLSKSKPTKSEKQKLKPVYRLAKEQEVAKVWAGCPVGFAFQVHKGACYLGYYQADRSMTIARREKNSSEWEYKVLPTKIGWDSHNYIVMTFDADDILHVAGNMHAVPLIYFRADKPNDISSLKRIPVMTGILEKRMTYPKFLTDGNNRLLFCYRDGGSGNGNTYWNRYDEKTKTWTRLMDKPIFDGQKLMNAYPSGPVKGSDGFYHLIWVWRDTPDCATNHDLTYARSKDLIHWEDSAGKPIPLPMTLAEGERIAPIPAGGGLLNSSIHLAFDKQGRVLISYSQYSPDGIWEVWNARREENGWRKVRASDWQVKWHFSGGGCIRSDARFSAVKIDAAGNLLQTWHDFTTKKSGTWYLDSRTLERRDRPEFEIKPTAPLFSAKDGKEIRKRRHEDPRMLGQQASVEMGDSLWFFHWETLPINRDRPQEGGAPAPSSLMFLEFVPTK